MRTTTRIRAAVATTALAMGTMLTVSAAPAQAAEWQCSSFQYGGGFRARACTKAISSTQIEHKTLVQNLNSYWATSKVRSYKIIGGAFADCKGNVEHTFAPGETRAWSCSSKRVSGTKYQTRGFFYSNTSMTSPGVWG